MGSWVEVVVFYDFEVGCFEYCVVVFLVWVVDGDGGVW